MACTPVGINQDNESCSTSDGGIRNSYCTDFANITSATFDANGQITAIVMTAPGLWEKFVYDDDDTAFFNSEGERTGKKHIFNQSAFMKFEGLTAAKIAAINALRECCNMVWIHRTNGGIALVQGLEDDGAGNIVRVKQSAKVTSNVMTDTGANADRVEITVNSVCKKIHPTDLTDVEIEAL
jgi:hypothetical protein